MALSARGVRKAYSLGDRVLEILHGVDLDVAPGELVALVGASGAGKSTLLHILGLLDRPDEGGLWIQGEEVSDASIERRAKLRNQTLGFVFQFYHLIPELNAVENVLLPAMIADSPGRYRRRRKELHEQAEGLLVRFGMQERLRHRPPQLSGGERQRVALARALLLDPAILLADEPTGNLDSATGERVLELLFEEQARRQLSLVLVTHDQRLAERCQRTLVMHDGKIQAT